MILDGCFEPIASKLLITSDLCYDCRVAGFAPRGFRIRHGEKSRSQDKNRGPTRLSFDQLSEAVKV